MTKSYFDYAELPAVSIQFVDPIPTFVVKLGDGTKLAEAKLEVRLSMIKDYGKGCKDARKIDWQELSSK